MHTPITFSVKGFDKNGKCVSSQSYFTPKLNEMNGHWCVVGRMVLGIKHNKKVKEVKVYMEDIEYVYSEEMYSYVPA